VVGAALLLVKTKVKGEKDEKNSLGSLVCHRLRRSYRNRVCKIEEGSS
jgi:hypothetical protein